MIIGIVGIQSYIEETEGQLKYQLRARRAAITRRQATQTSVREGAPGT